MDRIEELFRKRGTLMQQLEIITAELRSELDKGLNGHAKTKPLKKETVWHAGADARAEKTAKRPSNKRPFTKRVERKPFKFWRAAVADYILTSGNLTFTLDDIASYTGFPAISCSGAYGCDLLKSIGKNDDDRAGREES